jgi:hypothetical protein
MPRLRNEPLAALPVARAFTRQPPFRNYLVFESSLMPEAEDACA